MERLFILLAFWFVVFLVAFLLGFCKMATDDKLIKTIGVCGMILTILFSIVLAVSIHNEKSFTQSEVKKDTIIETRKIILVYTDGDTITECKILNLR